MLKCLKFYTRSAMETDKVEGTRELNCQNHNFLGPIHYVTIMCDEMNTDTWPGRAQWINNEWTVISKQQNTPNDKSQLNSSSEMLLPYSLMDVSFCLKHKYTLRPKWYFSAQNTDRSSCGKLYCYVFLSSATSSFSKPFRFFTFF